MMEHGNSQPRAGVAVSGMLSSRELEVLSLASAGHTNGEIAKRLDVTVHAVKFHLSSVYRKLGVANRTEAAVAFLVSDNASLSGENVARGVS
jgi:DNA-binding CsgD family transcriptional regulator